MGTIKNFIAQELGAKDEGKPESVKSGISSSFRTRILTRSISLHSNRNYIAA